MPASRNGVTSPRGFNATPDIETTVVTLTVANGTTIAAGQVLCRDVTQIPGSAGADIVVLPSSGNAGIPIAVYQGPAFTNNTGAAATYDVEAQTWGWGIVSAEAKTGGTAVKVGDTLILNGTDNAPISGSAALNVTIGQVLATGGVTAKGATVITVPGSGSTVQAVNAYINLR